MKLRRPELLAPREQRDAFYAEIRRVLDALGVEPGGAFLMSGIAVKEHNSLGPFAAKSETSRQAALVNYPRAGSQRWRVLHALGRASENGLTREELAGRLGLNGNTIRPRVWELISGDFVEDSGRTRPTAMNNKSEVLVLTPEGRREYSEDPRR